MSTQNILQHITCPKCKRIKTRCECTISNDTIRAEKSIKKAARKKGTNYVEKLLEVIKKKKVVDRKELAVLGFSSGGTLSKALRELENQGLIKLEIEKLPGCVKRTKIIYIGSS